VGGRSGSLAHPRKSARRSALPLGPQLREAADVSSRQMAANAEGAASPERQAKLQRRAKRVRHDPEASRMQARSVAIVPTSQPACMRACVRACVCACVRVCMRACAIVSTKADCAEVMP
jgi:hypothetical protein